MTTLEDIAQEVRTLLDSVGLLLATPTAEGWRDQIEPAVDLLLGTLDQLRHFLDGLREPVIQMRALAGLLEVMSSLPGLLNAAGTELARIGLTQAPSATGPAAAALTELGARVSMGAGDIRQRLPSVATIDELQKTVGDMVVTLSSYKAAPHA